MVRLTPTCFITFLSIFADMNIAFDAKRAFHNGTGLGHYSRTLIRSLSVFYPENQYYLCNPKPADKFQVKGKNLHEVLPSGFIDKLFSAAWRSNWVKKDLQHLRINIYHGLSHEIPIKIHQKGIKSVVTIHDLIHERFPAQYNPVDILIYNKKFRYACSHADKIIAISQQTKKDIINFYKIPEEKIAVCYQSCNPDFAIKVSEEEKEKVQKRYNLPPRFFLYVGSVIERKNLLNICKAMLLVKNEFALPLLVIGDGGKYKHKVKNFIRENKMEKKVIFLSENPAARSSASFQTATDFPAIYQSALAMIYPSYFEGFGIPVLEALWSKLPVITSDVSSLPEVGGNGAYYVNPDRSEEIAAGMIKLLTDENFTDGLKEKGWQHAQLFTPEKCARNVMNVYNSLW
jgi:glycosyltransferase involved in cell wall biosynthesis